MYGRGKKSTRSPKPVRGGAWSDYLPNTLRGIKIDTSAISDENTRLMIATQEKYKKLFLDQKAIEDQNLKSLTAQEAAMDAEITKKCEAEKRSLGIKYENLKKENRKKSEKLRCDIPYRAARKTSNYYAVAPFSRDIDCNKLTTEQKRLFDMYQAEAYGCDAKRCSVAAPLTPQQALEAQEDAEDLEEAENEEESAALNLDIAEVQRRRREDEAARLAARARGSAGVGPRGRFRNGYGAFGS